jgi:transposase-like protein
MNKRLRTSYPAGFKLQALPRAKAGDRPVRSLEQELGLSPNLLRQWAQQYDTKAERAFVRKAGATATRARSTPPKRTGRCCMRPV